MQLYKSKKKETKKILKITDLVGKYRANIFL